MSDLFAPRDERSGPGRVSVHLDGVGKRFADRVILDQLSFTAYQGEFVAILGRSGGGKTTLLRLIGGLEEPDAGEVLTTPQQTVVFQEPRLINGRRVWQNVVLGLPRDASARRRETALSVLREVGLEGREFAWPTQLSGGEAQRVALARALIRRPELLLLDEPFAALDALTRIRIQALVATLHANHNPTIVLVTHDVDEAILLADRIVVLQDGRIGAEYVVPFTRPRNRSVPGFGDLRQQLLDEIGVTESIG